MGMTTVRIAALAASVAIGLAAAAQAASAMLEDQRTKIADIVRRTGMKQ